MKLFWSVFPLLVFSLLTSCSPRKPELAATAVAKDFEGQWSGSWSWDPTGSTLVEISGTQLKVSGLPIEKTSASGDRMVAVSAQGEAQFESEYGSKGAPSVLLYFLDHKEVVPLFITKDKEHLIYTVDVNLNRRIIFRKREPAGASAKP